MNSQRMIVVESSDGVALEVEEAVAVKSEMIKGMMEEKSSTIPLRLPNVTSKILAMAIEFCKRHVDAGAKVSANRALRRKIADEEKAMLLDLKAFDAALVKAANDLKIESLLTLTCQSVSDMIKGKSPEEIRMLLNIKSGCTLEEEVVARRERA